MTCGTCHEPAWDLGCITCLVFLWIGLFAGLGITRGLPQSPWSCNQQWLACCCHHPSDKLWSNCVCGTHMRDTDAHNTWGPVHVTAALIACYMQLHRPSLNLQPRKPGRHTGSNSMMQTDNSTIQGLPSLKTQGLMQADDRQLHLTIPERQQPARHVAGA